MIPTMAMQLSTNWHVICPPNDAGAIGRVDHVLPPIDVTASFTAPARAYSIPQRAPGAQLTLNAEVSCAGMRRTCHVAPPVVVVSTSAPSAPAPTAMQFLAVVQEIDGG
jgi:hypothetical protein